jgi:hypothetical protein
VPAEFVEVLTGQGHRRHILQYVSRLVPGDRLYGDPFVLGTLMCRGHPRGLWWLVTAEDRPRYELCSFCWSRAAASIAAGRLKPPEDDIDHLVGGPVEEPEPQFPPGHIAPVLPLRPHHREES